MAKVKVGYRFDESIISKLDDLVKLQQEKMDILFDKEPGIAKMKVTKTDVLQMLVKNAYDHAKEEGYIR